MVAHSEILLSKCAQFRDQSQFIDVRLKVCEDIFPAHRIVLAANSDYFYAMFTDGMKESNQEVIELKDESISPDALKIVMDSIYTGDLRVNEKNVFEVLAAADHLRVISVVQQCCDFLKREFIQLQLDLHNYCLLSTVADRYGLRDLQEAAETKMASMYPDVCESEEFLSNVGADQLLSILSRDDLRAPSETFIFKSVMQWIKHKKEERMAVAAKVIGAVRLGLVDIKVVIEELNTEEMQGRPEIHLLLHEALLHYCMPSKGSTFAEGKAKLRSAGTALVAVLPEAQMQYFDFETKIWTSMSPASPLNYVTCCCYAESVGILFVGGTDSDGVCIYCYDIENNSWERQPHNLGIVERMCALNGFMYAIMHCDQLPQRYNFSKRQWQTFAKVGIRNDFNNYCYNAGIAVLGTKVYVLYGKRIRSHQRERIQFSAQSAELHCFDPVKNEWEGKAKTCQSHFGSNLIVVNNILYVVGGNLHINDYNVLQGNPAPVEAYNEENNTWSVVEQKHIPPNHLNAVEIEGRVYFIINKFPVDSGIRIPPGELYPVHLGDWGNLAKIATTAVLSYLPVKRESLKTD